MRMDDEVGLVFKGRTLRKGEYLDVSRWYWLRVESVSKGKVRLSYAEALDTEKIKTVESERSDNL